MDAIDLILRGAAIGSSILVGMRVLLGPTPPRKAAALVTFICLIGCYLLVSSPNLEFFLGRSKPILIIGAMLATFAFTWAILEILFDEIAASMRTVIIFTMIGVGIAFGATVGVLQVYTDLAAYGWVYFWASMLVIIVVHDAYFYWTHRLMHRPRFFRWLHRLHHKSYNPSPFSSYSFDSSEALVHAIFLPLILLVLPMHPIAIFIFTVHMMLCNAIGHCGYEVFPSNKRGKPLLGFLTTVTHHDLHHAHAGYNMGLYFSWWDKWMGTEHPDYLSEFSRVAARTANQARKA